MKVAKNKVVAVSYELNVEGKTADKAGSDAPLEYIHGTGMLLPKFESELESKEPGDKFEFTLTPEEGYGAYDPKYKVDIPKSAFEIDGKLREDLLVPGNVIPMLNSAGQVVQGKVESVGEDSVTMDFNHPMAGKTLHFTGKVESVREASEKELKEGLHGEYLPKDGCHCGKDCSCDDSCDCGCKDGKDCSCDDSCDCGCKDGKDCSCGESCDCK